jgi:tetratricopeptide (TPR) repeat protein
MVAAALEATEAPAGDAQLRDERLTFLREEVSRLQMRWESLEEAMQTNSSITAPVLVPAVEAAQLLSPAPAPLLSAPVTANTTEILGPITSTPGTTGMSATTRAELIQRLSAEELLMPSASSKTKTTFEPSGFSAHTVRHGRALYKAGRYEEALKILNKAADQAGANFWTASSLEKLGRTDEAIAAYDLVIASVTNTKDAQHAKRNRDFLIWKRDFDARISGKITSSAEGETL